MVIHSDGPSNAHVKQTHLNQVNPMEPQTISAGTQFMQRDDHHVTTPVFGHPVAMDMRKPFTMRSAYRIGSIKPHPGRTKRWPYTGYIVNSFKNIVLSFYFNWAMIFTAPLSTIALVTIYPTLIVFLVVFEFALKLFMEGLGGGGLLKHISSKHGEGFGAINWGLPALLTSDKTARLVQATALSLGLPATPIRVANARQRTFDISIAQTCVLLSSLIYERDSIEVKKALCIANKPRGKTEQMTKEEEDRIRTHLWNSEYRIRAIAEKWGLQFEGVSEMKSLGGPFCGIFWSETKPFIVVVFKGTTPTNYEEFLVDCTIQRMDASPYLFGSVHQGFYDSLFSTSAYGEHDIRDPYGAILDAVQTKAAYLQEKLNTTEPIQLWIGGHSLGAALSALLYSRWLKCPADLADKLVLRDAYVIGMPSVGDSDFASAFASYSNTPVTLSSTLWRIINKNDIVCRAPPGYDNKTIGNYVSDVDFFNYSHIGHAVQINKSWKAEPLKTYPSSHQTPMKVHINIGVEEQQIAAAEVSGEIDTSSILSPHLPGWAHSIATHSLFKKLIPKGNPIPIIESLYPFFMMDHIPSQYFKGLERARRYYKKELEVDNGSAAVESLIVNDHRIE